MEREILTKILNEATAEPFKKKIFYLAARWACESKHESFASYEDALKNEAEKIGLVVTGATKRPFGVHFDCTAKTVSGGTVLAVYHLYVKKTSARWHLDVKVTKK